MSKDKKFRIKMATMSDFFVVVLTGVAAVMILICVILAVGRTDKVNKEYTTQDTVVTKAPVDSEQTPNPDQSGDTTWGETTGSEETPAPETTTAPTETTTAPPETTPAPETTTTPPETLPPVQVTPPTPIDRPDNITYPLPASDKVADSYFNDVVFVGDSRTQGMQLYSGVKNATYYCAQSLSAYTALTKAFVNENGTDITLIEALKRHPELKKIYVSFGVNEYGLAPDNFKRNYSKLIDEILKVSPHAEIYIQAILPIDPNKTIYKVPQANLDKFNEKLMEIAKEKKVYYLDVTEPFVLADGVTRGLTNEVSTDGLHLNTAGVKRLFEYIRTHTAKY